MSDARELLREALEASRVALDDWLNTHAPEHCRESRVREATDRIMANGGTLAYIAGLQARNREALALSVAPQPPRLTLCQERDTQCGSYDCRWPQCKFAAPVPAPPAEPTDTQREIAAEHAQRLTGDFVVTPQAILDAWRAINVAAPAAEPAPPAEPRVPREATIAMIEAANGYMVAGIPSDIWRAMYDAAPAAEPVAQQPPPTTEYRRGLEDARIIALEQRCERGTPWDMACTIIAKKIAERTNRIATDIDMAGNTNPPDFVRHTVQQPPPDSDAMQRDLAEILRTVGLSDSACPRSPHEVVQRKLLPRLRELIAAQQPEAPVAQQPPPSREHALDELAAIGQEMGEYAAQQPEAPPADDGLVARLREVPRFWPTEATRSVVEEAAARIESDAKRIRALEADLRDSLLLAWGGVCPKGWVMLWTPQEIAEQIRRAGDALQAELAASRERERLLTDAVAETIRRYSNSPGMAFLAGATAKTIPPNSDDIAWAESRATPDSAASPIGGEG